MKQGRPREFDRQDALERATEVFWTKGYEGTSVRDLLQGMRINRGSMYDTFGDKRSLFLEAIGHYLEHVAAPLVGTLNQAGSPLANIRQTLEKLVEVAGTKNCRGCLLTNVAVEIAPHDAEVAASVKTAMLKTEGAFDAALIRAVEQGEIPKKADTRALARFLVNTMQGLVVLSKGKLGKQTCGEVIDVAMTALKA